MASAARLEAQMAMVRAFVQVILKQSFYSSIILSSVKGQRQFVPLQKSVVHIVKNCLHIIVFI